MSGHSKWKTIKHAKAATDAKRGKIFSLIGKEITLAAKTGGGNPDFNPQLRTILAKAKSANMPSDNIKRAIQKGTGEIPGIQIEELTYEGYGPSGVGFIVEVTTDSKNRAVSEVRSVFTRCGGNLAEPGALNFIFQRKGQVLIAHEQIQEEALLDIALAAGAEDVITETDHYEVLCPVANFYGMVKALEDANLKLDFAELVYLPAEGTTINITDVDVKNKLEDLTERLEDLEDVKSVYSNYELDASISSDNTDAE